ncbi:MAG: ROK family protein [Clostridia bacterium]|nr:ROK family protein [Clostridia bacterium]
MRVGIDLGGTAIKIGFVDERCKIVAKGKTATNVGRPYGEIIADMAKLIKEFARQNSVSLSEIESIGIGSPGVADSQNGVLIFSNNLNWKHVPVRQELQKHFDVPVFLENDANCAALGESIAGASSKYASSVLVTLGTGVGGGIVIGGRIHNGFNGGAGEIGHMVIVAGGEKCSCGRNGCFERYASASALVRSAQKAAEQNPDSLLSKMARQSGEMNGIVVMDAARAGDMVTLELLDRFREYVAVGLANIANVLQPEAIVIGGGISNEGEFLIGGIREKTYAQMYTDAIKYPAIVAAQLGNDAGIIGAAMLGEK